MSHRWLRHVLFALGLALVAFGFWELLPQSADVVWMNASSCMPEPCNAGSEKAAPNYLGWGMLVLGFLTLGSNHYFKLREARRADRGEARDVAAQRRATDDLN